MNKAENAANRFLWLHKVLEGEIDLNKIDPDFLKDAKSFCEMSIEGLFVKISYNTLRSYLVGTSVDKFRMHAYKDNFEYLLDLRRKTRLKLLASRSCNKDAKVKYTESDWKQFYRNALWQSNLCANAYITLRRDVQAILNSKTGDDKLDFRRLEKTLIKSDQVYSKIISAEPEPFIPDLKLVKE